VEQRDGKIYLFLFKPCECTVKKVNADHLDLGRNNYSVIPDESFFCCDQNYRIYSYEVQTLYLKVILDQSASLAGGLQSNGLYLKILKTCCMFSYQLVSHHNGTLTAN
jgi:hypothetical protein